MDALSVFDDSNLPSDESGNLMNMIMDSGAEEHMVSLTDWESLGEPMLTPTQVRLRNGSLWQFYGAWMVRKSNGGVDSFGGDSSYQVFAFCNESAECWLQQRDEAHSICFASQWRRLHTASTLR